MPCLLQAMIRGELDVLKDWCYEAVSYTCNKILVPGTSCVFFHLYYSECVKPDFSFHFLLLLYCTCPQTYSQLAHPIQQARALGLLFQSKILDIDNIDVSAFTLVQQPHTVHYFTPDSR